MEARKLNQSRLNYICYALGSYDIVGLSLDFYGKYVYIKLGRSNNFIPQYIMNEISEIMGDTFGVVCLSGSLCLMFERENPVEELSIPEGLEA